MLSNCIDLITTQQGTDQNSPVYWVGEQLKDIVKSTPGASELVAIDLEMPGKSIADCEKKIKEYADEHKSGNCAVVPPPVADKIIREFYGIAERGAGPIIDLADLL